MTLVNIVTFYVVQDNVEGSDVWEDVFDYLDLPSAEKRLAECQYGYEWTNEGKRKWRVVHRAITDNLVEYEGELDS